ncbi:hypothetical protein [Kozakia baliensis]|uniref:hypothetical protein n=1 Tax=Kozakia baliensis TaxID=153496 RepID=UPI0012681E4C|nr:hypothetical protein [Kozakia baliensis]
MAVAAGYEPKYASKNTKSRFPLRIGDGLIERIDAFGIPANCRSRNEAIIRLIESGLAAETEKASGAYQASPDASQQ